MVHWFLCHYYHFLESKLHPATSGLSDLPYSFYSSKQCFFPKDLCCSLHLISSASLSIFSMSLLGLQLQLEQPQLVTSSRSFSLLALVQCNCLPFLFFQLNALVPRNSNINKVTLSFSFYNTTMPSLLC